MPLQAVLPTTGPAEHEEADGSPTSPTAHWAARAGSASQRDSGDGDATDGEYVDAAAASVGNAASPTAHWAQPRGVAEQQVWCSAMYAQHSDMRSMQTIHD